MKNFIHAAEYHMHGEKLSKALNASRQAELIALQVSLFPNKEYIPCILNLTNPQILKLITTTLRCVAHLNFFARLCKVNKYSDFSFSQARILVESYNYPVDWSTVIFEQYIIRNQTDYFEQFVTYLPLTDHIVHDVTRKFLISKSDSKAAAQNMKNMVNTLSSVHTKYRLASELGFSDVVQDLLEGNQLSYLKDTVWKKGYKNS